MDNGTVLYLSKSVFFMLNKVLQGIGLNSNEAKVYLVCLKLGTQDIDAISQKTGFSPYETSLILTNLLDRGFISKFAKGKDFFTAEKPHVLLKILENTKYKMEKSIKVFSSVLPKFEEFMNPALTKPEISFYEGKEGIIAAYEDSLTSKTDILAIASVEDTESYFPEYVPKYYKRRKTAGIFIRAIFPDSKMARQRHERDKEELRISKIIPNTLLKFHIELYIYEDKVAYFSVAEELAVIVKSKIIAESMRDVFELCWKMAEIYQENLDLKAAQQKKE